MKLRLLDLLACPWCGQPFDIRSYDASSSSTDIVEGVLISGCGRRFPIVRGIPRIIENAADLFPEFVRRHAGDFPDALKGPVSKSRTDAAIEKTRKSFGYQWTVFREMVIDFRENFFYYIRPLDEAFFKGKLGLDMGCGFGRHIYNAALFGAEMVGVDLSDAIESTAENTRELPNVHLVQADVYHLPFKPGVFDFAYSIGVLHHLPDPERGYQSLLPIVKPGGSVFIWVYSKRRAVVNAILEAARAVTTRVPPKLQQGLSFTFAAVDWWVIKAYQGLAGIPGVGRVMRKLPLPRLRLYTHYPFQVVYADWFDRFAAPIRFYYDEHDLTGWVSRARLRRTSISPTGLFGWRAYGERE
jgi:SAM-dependent methyltransferase